MKYHRLQFRDMVYEKLKELGHYYPKDVVYWTNRAFTECLVDMIENGDELEVRGVFSIEPRLIKAHKVGNFGRNPLTIPEHYIPYIKASTKMKEACKNLMDKENEQQQEDNECTEE